MYQALYRKYRPTTLEDVAGQKVIIQTLKNAIENNKISHAYLFSGPRGTGKTSIAKILAKTINCTNLNGYIPCDNCNSCNLTNDRKNIDIIEIDAASNNGVDEIRELKNNVNLVPNNSNYKVYIIDEVHMLTISAFNALLKTLEEPPKYVVFILATTELHKVPETILSRCQKFDFKRISVDDIKKRLNKICELEKIVITDDSLDYIANYSNGGMRDAISLLDQVVAYSKEDKIDVENVREVCGNISNEQMFDFVKSVFNNDLSNNLEMLNKFNESGKNILIFYENLVEYLKNLLIYMNASDYFSNTKEKESFKELSLLINEEEIFKIIDILLEYIKNMKYENNKKLLAELAIIKIFNRNKINMVSVPKIQEIKEKFEKKELSSKELPTKKTKKISQNKKEVMNENVNNVDINLLGKIKKLRVNNALALFKKKDLLEFINKIDEINELLMDPEYSYLVSLILDGKLKAKGNEFLIFVYDTEKLSLYFNSLIDKIEHMFVHKYGINYKIIALSLEEWNNYKLEFNSSLKMGKNKFQFIEEDNTLLKEYFDKLNGNKNNNQNINNDIDNTFSEIVKYE